MTNTPDQGNMFNNPTADKSQNENGGSTTTQQVFPSNDDGVADQLQSIQNEDGKPKYDSVSKALDALGHSQTFIGELKNENSSLREQLDQLREEVNKSKSVDEVMTELAAQNNQTEATPPAQGLDEAAVQELVQKALTNNAQQNQAANNFNSVTETLTAKFGEKAKDAVAAKANELGTTPEEIGELAKQNPQLVLALFNGGTASNAAPSTSTVNMPAGPVSNEVKVEPPEKSLLSGASTKDQTEYMRKIKAATNKRLGIEG